MFVGEKEPKYPVVREKKKLVQGELKINENNSIFWWGRVLLQQKKGERK